MEYIIYIMYFCIGALIGSFLSLAIYRIPLKQNITHQNSYCPTCKQKLKFLDLIPIVSYIIQKGKCRYCESKYGKRYIILELVCGFIFTIIMAIQNSYNIVYLIFSVLYFSTIGLMLGILIEKKKIYLKPVIFLILIILVNIFYIIMR